MRMTAQVISICISVLGFLFTFAGLSRKMITKDDIAEMKSDIKSMLHTQNSHGERIAVLEYKVEELKK